MERILSVEDKIRRAEEIYNRRRENEYKITNTRVRVDNTKTNSNQGTNQKLRKMIIQIIVCMSIYFTFYYIINNNYIFSEDFRNKCEEILSYDISFSQIYKNIKQVFTSLEEKYQEIIENSEMYDDSIKQQQNDGNSDETQATQQENESTDNSEDENDEHEEMQENADESIGGAGEFAIGLEETGMIEEKNLEEVQEDKELTEEEQMKKDAEEIKSKISFIKPLVGTITSRFGLRNPTVSTVSKYHTGIDIAAQEGTNIISATSGKVILASSTGAYGNHLKIETEGTIILYAHCLSLEVNEGDEIAQGQVIAQVGTTGNSTGPHLHFEIRKEDRYVDPDLILDF